MKILAIPSILALPALCFVQPAAVAGYGDWVKVDPPSYQAQENKTFPCPNATFENHSMQSAQVPSWSEYFSMDFYVTGSSSTTPPWGYHFNPLDSTGKNSFTIFGPKANPTTVPAHHGYRADAHFLWVYGIEKWVKSDPVEAHEREMSKYYYGDYTETFYELWEPPTTGGGAG